jgi:hypothetical protein
VDQGLADACAAGESRDGVDFIALVEERAACPDPDLVQSRVVGHQRTRADEGVGHEGVGRIDGERTGNPHGSDEDVGIDPEARIVGRQDLGGVVDHEIGPASLGSFASVPARIKVLAWSRSTYCRRSKLTLKLNSAPTPLNSR